MSTQDDFSKQLGDFLKASPQTPNKQCSYNNNVITLAECNLLYRDKTSSQQNTSEFSDGDKFFFMVNKFSSRKKAERFVSLCCCNFEIACEIGFLCHWNYDLIQRFASCVVEHPNSYPNSRLVKRIALLSTYLSYFRSSLSPAKEALDFLSKFGDDVVLAKQFASKFKDVGVQANQFLSKFEDNGKEANTFLSNFNNDTVQATQFLSNFKDNAEQAKLFLAKFGFKDNEAIRFLAMFQDDADQANSFLGKFKNDVRHANKFLSSFQDNGVSANKFLADHHDDVVKATQMLSSFNGDGSQAIQLMEKNQAETQAKEKVKAVAAGALLKEFNGDQNSANAALQGCKNDSKLIATFIEQTKITKLSVLYDSEEHPRTAIEFHTRCDGQGPTVTFIHANNNSVCGVTNASWRSSNGPSSDANAYLVRLSPNPQKFPIKPDQKNYAICSSPARGPTFGGGFDLLSTFTAVSQKNPKGMYGVVSPASYPLPFDDFLFPSTDGSNYPIDQIVVCRIEK